MKLLRTAAFLLVAASPALAQITPFSINANTGFTGWTVTPSSNSGVAGSFSTVSIGANQTGSQIATFDGTNNRSWGLYANSGSTASAVYNFGGTLQPGNTVTISMDNGFINGSSRVGFALENSSGTARFQFFFEGGLTNYRLIDSSAARDFAPAQVFSSTGFSLTFTQLASNNYNIAYNATSATNESTLTASDISRIRIYNQSAGSGSDFDAYFNNLTVVPEPSTYAAFAGALGLGAAVMLRRRKA